LTKKITSKQPSSIQIKQEKKDSKKHRQKKPLNVLQIYLNHKKREFNKKFPESKSKDLEKMLLEKWRKMKPEEKEKYKKKYDDNQK
jgi:hypothetical protein